MPIRLSALVVAVCLLTPAAPAQECAPPAARDDGWKVGAPESVGLDGARLCAIVPHLAGDSTANVHAVLVARRGILVFEHYFAGEDERLGRPLGLIHFDPDTTHDQRSISKSVTSLLVGIAIGAGKLTGVDVPVLDFFPEYPELRSPEKARIQLKHLLTMSSGLAWDESSHYTDHPNSFIRSLSAPDHDRFVLEQLVETAPGERFNYNTGGIDLIGTMIQKATGQPLEAFAHTVLFEPLGIADFEWLGPPGYPMAGAGLRLRPRDLAKLGQLVLAKGAWNGRQIVPAAWIAASTKPQIAGDGPYFYGYLWWLGRSPVGGRELGWAAAFGLGGQRLYIVPALDLVVAVNAGLYRSPRGAALPLEILNHYVLTALRDR